jgi:quercetin dioxygenase-like cupin family protein
MIIIRGDSKIESSTRSDTFTGEVWAHPVLPRTDDVTIATVFFAPGARTFWHSHERGQILEVVAGRGFVCSAGGDAALLSIGDTVWVPPGERHWHGASQGSFLTHTAISLGTTSWLGEVAQDDYVSAHERSPSSEVRL